MPKTQEAPQTDAPPYEKYFRNEAGLLSNVQYKFKEDGSINWREMIYCKYIVLNKDKAAKISEKYNTTLEDLQNKIQTGEIDEKDVDDQFKLLLLAGIKDLARLRGYESVNHQVISSSPEFVAVKTTIKWIKNYEDCGVEFSSLADAHTQNTRSFALNFLSTIAENRGFVRCVRNSLGIHIVGSDEMGNISSAEEQPESVPKISPTGPNAAVISKFNSLHNDFKVSWGTFTKFAAKNGLEEAISWENSASVPAKDCYQVLGLLGEARKKKESKVTE